MLCDHQCDFKVEGRKQARKSACRKRNVEGSLTDLRNQEIALHSLRASKPMNVCATANGLVDFDASLRMFFRSSNLRLCLNAEELITAVARALTIVFDFCSASSNPAQYHW